MAELFTSHRSVTTAPRRFVDSVGVSWTIYRILPQALLEGAVTLLPHADRRRGWLLFESDEGERRRLAPYPDDWAEVTAFELERWCMRAVRTEDLPRRRSGDTGQPSHGTR